MARPNFYADNANRSYPILRGEEFCANSAVVDAGFIIGPNTGFNPAEHQVMLYRVERLNGNFHFYFSCDAPGLIETPLVFTRSVTAPVNSHEYTDTEHIEGSVSESVSPTCPGILWSGFLVTGPLENLRAELPGDGALAGEAPIEPACVRSLVQTFVRSVNLANADRTRYEVPDGCNPQCLPFDLQEIYVRTTCIQGAIRFQEGYNVSIRQDGINNAIIFDGIVGGGAGEHCEEVPVFDGEEPPTGGGLLDGSIDCLEVFRSINGVQGRVVTISGGPGVRVTSLPSQSKIIIDVNMIDMAACLGETEEEECSVSESAPGECECGPVV